MPDSLFLHSVLLADELGYTDRPYHLLEDYSRNNSVDLFLYSGERTGTSIGNVSPDMQSRLLDEACSSSTPTLFIAAKNAVVRCKNILYHHRSIGHLVLGYYLHPTYERRMSESLSEEVRLYEVASRDVRNDDELYNHLIVESGEDNGVRSFKKYNYYVYELDKLFPSVQGKIIVRGGPLASLYLKYKAYGKVLVFYLVLFASIIALLYGILWLLISKRLRRIHEKIYDHVQKRKIELGAVQPHVDEITEIDQTIEDLFGKLNVYEAKIATTAQLTAIGSISSHIAHDMRSPLSVLKIYSKLKSSACEDQDIENLRQSAERSVGKLERMAVDLVDYAKASKLQRARHQLSGIIYEGSIAEAKKRAEEKGVDLHCVMQGGILINVDSYKIERVITNLVNNAVQAIENPSTQLPTTGLGTGGTGGGEVSIAATTEHNGVLKITVKDNGKGIDPEALPQIFDSFFTKGKRGGSGLGLAYCKQVIEAHGGTIDVESELGKGTIFTIKIPQCAVEHSTGEVKAKVESQPQSQSKPAFSRVLIADDDPEIRRQWQEIIPEHGGTVVHSAKTVKEVEEAAIDYSKIDTAIVDYQFYGEDKTGIDLIKHLKAKGVKTVYLCTGFYDNEVIIKQAQAAGVDRILPKPIDPSLLA